MATHHPPPTERLPSFPSRGRKSPFPDWIARLHASRFYTRKLLRLDSWLKKGIWLCSDGPAGEDQAPLSQRTRREIAGLRTLISAQLPFVEGLRHLPFHACDTDMAPRCLLAAEHYLNSHGEVFDPQAYCAYLTERYSNGSLSYKEMRAGLGAIQLCCLLRVHDVYSRSLAKAATHAEPALETQLHTLSLVSSLDQDEYLARITPFEGVLAHDPALLYERLHPETKDMYRLAADDLAKLAGMSPEQLLKVALRLAQNHLKDDPAASPVEAHVGFYLIDDGRPALFKAAGVDAPVRTAPRSFSFSRHMVLEVSASLLLTLLACVLMKVLSLPPFWLIASICSVAILCWNCVTRSVELLFPMFVEDRKLPRMDYRAGIPPECAAAVCIPTLLFGLDHLKGVVRLLEEHYLTVPHDNLLFVLVTDYTDSLSKMATAEEQQLLKTCMEMVGALNRKYGSDGRNPFLVLHRERQFSEMQQRWMGLERKRGKLDLVNKLIVYGDNKFDSFTGDLQALKAVKYAIVLDDACRIAGFSIRALLETISHPLNQPRFNSNGQLERGYAILRPYECISKPSPEKWEWWPNAIIGPTFETDNLPLTSRNPHFDLFAECAHLGKGLYHVQAYDRLVAAGFPFESTLCHDLLESNAARTGFAAGAPILELWPSCKLFYPMLHRWARGDWQNILFQLFPLKQPDPARSPAKLRPFIFYVVLLYVRRSLIPIAKSVLLLAVIFGGAQSAGVRLAVALAIFLFPDYLVAAISLVSLAFSGLLRHGMDRPFRQLAIAHIGEAFKVVSSIHVAVIMLDAIVRTVYRHLTKRRLLEWTASSFSEHKSGAMNIADTSAVFAFLCSLVIFFFLLSSKSYWCLPSLAIALLWFTNPLVYLNALSSADTRPDSGLIGDHREPAGE